MRAYLPPQLSVPARASRASPSSRRGSGPARTPSRVPRRRVRRGSSRVAIASGASVDRAALGDRSRAGGTGVTVGQRRSTRPAPRSPRSPGRRLDEWRVRRVSQAASPRRYRPPQLDSGRRWPPYRGRACGTPIAARSRVSRAASQGGALGGWSRFPLGRPASARVTPAVPRRVALASRTSASVPGQARRAPIQIAGPRACYAAAPRRGAAAGPSVVASSSLGQRGGLASYARPQPPASSSGNRPRLLAERAHRHAAAPTGHRCVRNSAMRLAIERTARPAPRGRRRSRAALAPACSQRDRPDPRRPRRGAARPERRIVARRGVGEHRGDGSHQRQERVPRGGPDRVVLDLLEPSLARRSLSATQVDDRRTRCDGDVGSAERRSPGHASTCRVSPARGAPRRASPTQQPEPGQRRGQLRSRRRRAPVSREPQRRDQVVRARRASLRDPGQLRRRAGGVARPPRRAA